MLTLPKKINRKQHQIEYLDFAIPLHGENENEIMKPHRCKMWCVSLPLEKSLDFISVWSILIGEHMRDHLRAFYSQLKSKVGNILIKAAALRIDLKIDGAPIASRSHTHPRTLKPLAFSPRPSPSVSPSRSTQCVRGF